MGHASETRKTEFSPGYQEFQLNPVIQIPFSVPEYSHNIKIIFFYTVVGELRMKVMILPMLWASYIISEQNDHNIRQNNVD